jgi:hypothetical protein
MTLLRLARPVLLAAALTAAALPVAAQGRTAAAPRHASPLDSPSHCAAPARVGDGSRIALALDWPHRPLAPGTAQALGIHITNVSSTPTPNRTLVVVHGFVPNRYTAGRGLALADFATGVSFTVPAGIGPGRTVSHTVTVKLGPSIPPNATEHCDVSAFSGGDQATTPYDVVTGAPVVHLSATVRPVRARPGRTVDLDAVLANAGPSNEYTGPAVFTFQAPEHTRWASPSAARCTPDAPGRILTCSYPGSPLTWRDDVEQFPLDIDRSASPGTRLHGGAVTATDPFDPQPFHARFTVGVAR